MFQYDLGFFMNKFKKGILPVNFNPCFQVQTKFTTIQRVFQREITVFLE